jgi:RNA polymerase sigma-70 factor (sigma-E family)
VGGYATVAPWAGSTVIGDARPPGARWTADVALEELYAAHWRSLVRLAVLLVRDVGTAEEVVQDAFVSVHARWDRLRDHEKALAYLRQCVVNGSRSVLRRRGTAARFVRREAGAPPPVAPSAEQLVEAGDRRAAVLDAMAALPDRQREVLALRYYVDLSEAEIAAALGIATGSVKSHASRGSAALRASLGHLLEENS